MRERQRQSRDARLVIYATSTRRVVQFAKEKEAPLPKSGSVVWLRGVTRFGPDKSQVVIHEEIPRYKLFRVTPEFERRVFALAEDATKDPGFEDHRRLKVNCSHPLLAWR